MTKRLALVALFLGGCVANVPEPTLEHVRGDEASLRTLLEGRRLYVAKCSGCHGLFSVEKFSDREWDHEVAEMVRLKKAKLQPEEIRSLVAYLTTLNGRD